MTLGTGTHLGPVSTIRAVRARFRSVNAFCGAPIGATYEFLPFITS